MVSLNFSWWPYTDTILFITLCSQPVTMMHYLYCGVICPLLEAGKTTYPELSTQWCQENINDTLDRYVCSWDAFLSIFQTEVGLVTAADLNVVVTYIENSEMGFADVILTVKFMIFHRLISTDAYLYIVVFLFYFFIIPSLKVLTITHQFCFAFHNFLEFHSCVSSISPFLWYIHELFSISPLPSPVTLPFFHPSLLTTCPRKHNCLIPMVFIYFICSNSFQCPLILDSCCLWYPYNSSPKPHSCCI